MFLNVEVWKHIFVEWNSILLNERAVSFFIAMMWGALLMSTPGPWCTGYLGTFCTCVPNCCWGWWKICHSYVYAYRCRIDRMWLWKVKGFHHTLNVINIYVYWYVYKWLDKLEYIHKHRYNVDIHTCVCIISISEYIHMGMDQYLLIPFLGEWTSTYQLFWCSPGVQGFDTLPYTIIYTWWHPDHTIAHKSPHLQTLPTRRCHDSATNGVSQKQQASPCSGSHLSHPIPRRRSRVPHPTTPRQKFWWSSRKPSDTVSMVKMVCTNGWLWMIYLENPRKNKQNVIFHGQIYEFIMIIGIIGYVRESNAMICLFSAMILEMTIATGLNSWTDPFWIAWGSRVWNIHFMKRNTSGNLKWKTSLGIMTKFLSDPMTFYSCGKKGLWTAHGPPLQVGF